MQRSAPQEAVAAPNPNPPPCSLAALPLVLLRAILLCVPVDTRLRCREVCCGWRDALSEPALWAAVDLSAQPGGVAVT